MAIYVVCVCEDLKKDAELFVGMLSMGKGGGAALVADFSKLGDGDTAVLYAHGQYVGATKAANNKIIGGSDALTADIVAAKLVKDLGLPTNKSNICVFLHACFTSGSREVAPKSLEADTFAGQLCSALKASIATITVIGFVGQAKMGRAGFPIDAPTDKRVPRSAVDAHAGALWQVSYAVGSGGKIVATKGASVAWH